MTRYALSLSALLVAVAITLSVSGCPKETTTTAPPTQPVTGTQPAAPTHDPVDAVRTVSFGEEVDISDYAAEGQSTIFDFYSEACGPCRALAPELEALAEERDDISLVVVDINRPGQSGIDWKSPVAQQYELNSIPHLRVFGPDGKELARADDARAMVDGWLQ